MKYGIVQEGLTCKCSNCGKVVSRDGTLNENYCSNCGTPLSVIAIAEYSDQMKEANKALLTSLVEVAKRNQTDSFLRILEIYKNM